MRIVGGRSDRMTRSILELFVVHEQLRALDVCNIICKDYSTSRRAVNSRLQRMRNEEVLDYVEEADENRWVYMKLTLHGECLLTALRIKDGDFRSATQKSLANHKRWGQRRKNATPSTSRR
jgi:hypothetical protein